MATLGEVVGGLFSQKPEPPPPAAPAGLFGPPLVQTDEQRKEAEKKRQSAVNRAYFINNVADLELSPTDARKYTKGTDYVPFLVGKDKPSPTGAQPYTAGFGVLINNQAKTLIKEGYRDMYPGQEINLSNINESSRIPKQIIDQIAYDRWDAAVEAASKKIGRDNPAKFVLASMVYQMGQKSAFAFTKTIDYLNMGTAEGYSQAAREIYKGTEPGTYSKWSTDTRERVDDAAIKLEAIAAGAKANK